MLGGKAKCQDTFTAAFCGGTRIVIPHASSELLQVLP